MAIETRVVESDILKSWLGIASAFVLTLTAIISGSVLVWHGHDWAGGAIATSGLAGLAGTFIYGTSSQRRERTEKAKIMSGRK